MQMSIQWMNKVSTGISEVFVRHFGWYLRLYFRFLLRMVFVMHFGFLDAGKKNKY